MKSVRLHILFFFLSAVGSAFAQKHGAEEDSIKYHLTQLINGIKGGWSGAQIESCINKRKLAEKIITESSSIETRLKDPEQRYLLYVNTVYVLFDHALFTDAQKAAFLALNAAEKSRSKPRIASAYVTVANNFSELRSSSQAMEYLRKSAKLLIESGREDLLPAVYNNMSNAFYQDTEKHPEYLDSAMICNMKALSLAKKYSDTELEERVYQSMGLIETDLEHYAEAEAAFKNALAISTLQKNEENITYNYYQIGRMYTNMQDRKTADSAIKYLFKGLEGAKRLENATLIGEIHYHLTTAYYTKEEFKLSAEYAMRFSDLNDSLTSLKSTEEIAELSERYQSAKKEAVITQLHLDQKEQEEKINRQLYMIIGAGAILLAVTGVVFVLYRSNKLRQKINAELLEKNRLIEHQKVKVEEQNSLINEKNKEIIDSIRYAQRIQKALLPNEKLIARILNKK
jgi:tetratricopeptide (TPR) repeat protein